MAIKNKKLSSYKLNFLLPDLDSNQDKQYQKLSYYPYTIGQAIKVKEVFLCFDDANIERFLICPKLFFLFFCIYLDYQMNKFSCR